MSVAWRHIKNIGWCNSNHHLAATNQNLEQDIFSLKMRAEDLETSFVMHGQIRGEHQKQVQSCRISNYAFFYNKSCFSKIRTIHILGGARANSRDPAYKVWCQMTVMAGLSQGI